MARWVSCPLAPAQSALAQKLFPHDFLPWHPSPPILAVPWSSGMVVGAVHQWGLVSRIQLVQPWPQDLRSPRLNIGAFQEPIFIFFLHLHSHGFQSDVPRDLPLANIYPLITGGG